MTNGLLPISAIIPTRNRVTVLQKTLGTIASQEQQPTEVIIIDASEHSDTQCLCERGISGLRSKLLYLKAAVPGAAAQRNQGIEKSSQPFIAFMDDDIYLEKGCMSKLWDVISNDERAGGVNALISNQQFHPPGRVSRILYSLFTSRDTLNNLEGKTIGPAVNFLSSERNKLPVIPVDWLNLGLTIYRKAALPDPVFHPHFKGYSYMEDAALSFIVARQWKLFTVRDARIFHDSQPGDHKNNSESLATMELVNRYFIMTEILRKRSFKDKVQFIIFQLFFTIASGGSNWKLWKGKWIGIRQIWFTKEK